MALGGFAMNGQGMAGSKKASVAAGGPATASDKALSTGFTSGKGASISRGGPVMNDAPQGGARGVSGTSLPVGKQSGATQAVTPSLKNAGTGVSGTSLPIGRQKL
jgi:hypothetical protein